MCALAIRNTQESIDMRPIRWGLAAALVAVLVAPIAVMSAPPAKITPMSSKDREQLTPIVQASGAPCQVSDARLIGKGSDPKTKVESTYYEVACGAGQMGYILIAPKGGQPTAMSCIETADKTNPLNCALPANADPKAALGPIVAKAGISCPVTNARGIGETKTNTLVEVACQGGSGYILIASAPLDPAKPVEAQNCLAFDDQAGNIKCELSDKAARLAVVDRLAQAANNGCVVKDRRFVGTAQSGGDFYEAACQDGKGYIFKAGPGATLAQTWNCAQAQNILGGCTLTDARQASAEQAALYTKMAHNAGSTCDVDHYALFGMQGSDEVVELACKSGQGAVGVFPPTGVGKVYDCAHAVVMGIECRLNKSADFASLTADLHKFNVKTCEVSKARLMGETPKKTRLVEVACADGLKGYVLEYKTEPTVAAVGATGCAFAGGCKLPGNV
jgi:hypothetical protein